MQKRWLFVGITILLSVLIIILHGKTPHRKCKAYLEKARVLGNFITITTRVNQRCPGIEATVFYKSGKYKIYVNLEHGIIKGAPPMGFSIKAPDKEYISLGVDKHIIDTNLPVRLKQDSKITLINNFITVKWRIKAENINYLSQIKIGDTIIKHIPTNECRLIYDSYLTTPRKHKIPACPVDTFLKFCRTKWMIYKKNSGFKRLFRLTRYDIQKIEKEHNYILLKFLNIYKKEKIQKGKICRIHISLIDLKDYKQIEPAGFSFVLEKINKETFKKTFYKPDMDVFSGTYIVRAISKQYKGTSRLIDCETGDYYVAILLKNHI